MLGLPRNKWISVWTPPKTFPEHKTKPKIFKHSPQDHKAKHFSSVQLHCFAICFDARWCNKNQIQLNKHSLGTFLVAHRKPCKIPQSNIMKNNFSLSQKIFQMRFSVKLHKRSGLVGQKGARGLRQFGKVFPRNKFNYKCLILCKKLEWTLSNRSLLERKGQNWDEIKFSEWIASQAKGENKDRLWSILKIIQLEDIFESNLVKAALEQLLDELVANQVV